MRDPKLHKFSTKYHWEYLEGEATQPARVPNALRRVGVEEGCIAGRMPP